MKRIFNIKPKEEFVEIKVKPFLNKRNNQMSVAIPRKLFSSNPKQVTLRFPKSIMRGGKK
jgi:hypothetical protein